MTTTYDLPVPDGLPEAPEGFELQLWTYLGRFTDAAGKLAHAWEESDGTRHSYSGSITKGSPVPARPGARFFVFASETHVKSGGGPHAPRYAGMIRDADRVRDLQLQDRQAAAEARLVKEAKGEMSYDHLAELLAPLTARYNRSNADGRAALLGLVFQIITTGRGAPRR